MEVSTANQQRPHSKPLSESHLDVLRRGIASDVTFIVGPSKEKIPCHRIFLAARSPVFEVVFSERWNQDKEIPLEHIDPKIFKKFLEFIYADTFVANLPEIVELLQVARLYDVRMLVSRCEEELLANEVPLNDAVDVFQATQNIQLMEKAADVVLKSLSELQSLPSFLRVDKETLVYILKRDCVNMKEVDLFRLAVKWAKNQSDLTMEENLKDILPLIRFPVMTLEEFTTHVLPSGLLSQSTLIEVFKYFGTDDAETKTSLAKTLKFNTERRRSIDSVHYFDLYSGDLDRKETKFVQFEKLEDSVLISACIPGPTTKKILLKGISVYCPAKVVSTGSRPASSTFKEFKVVLKIWNGRTREYQILGIISPVQAEEGKMTEIKFGTCVLLDKSSFLITVEEIPPRRTHLAENREDYYAVKVFGPFERELTLNDNSVWVKSYADSFEHPQLICRLGLEF